MSIFFYILLCIGLSMVYTTGVKAIRSAQHRRMVEDKKKPVEITPKAKAAKQIPRSFLSREILKSEAGLPDVHRNPDLGVILEALDTKYTIGAINDHHTHFDPDSYDLHSEQSWACECTNPYGWSYYNSYTDAEYERREQAQREAPDTCPLFPEYHEIAQHLSDIRTNMYALERAQALAGVQNELSRVTELTNFYRIEAQAIDYAAKELY